jgi:hypothetical protein
MTPYDTQSLFTERMVRVRESRHLRHFTLQDRKAMKGPGRRSRRKERKSEMKIKI